MQAVKTSNQGRINSLFTVMGILIFVGVLVMVSFNRIAHKIENNHAMVLTFRTFQKLNHNLNENILRTRSFLLKNYDPLVSNVQEMQAACKQIESATSPFMTSNSEEITNATLSFCRPAYRAMI